MIGVDRRRRSRTTCPYNSHDVSDSKRDSDYRPELGEAALKHGCALHAYVLMTNHMHLLVTPGEPGAASRMMQAIGRRYVGCFNARYRRTGTLWEGRFKSAWADNDRYLLICYRYIELNPVRAGMVVHPRDYRWSSHHCNAHGIDEARITPHPCYLDLGLCPTERQHSYRALFQDALPAEDTEALRAHTRQQRALGSDRFGAQVEALTQRAAVRGRGINEPDLFFGGM